MGEGRSELIENPSAHSFGPSSHGERPPGRPSGHLAQHAGSDQPGSEIQPGAGRDIEPLGEQASGDQRLAQRDGAGRVQSGAAPCQQRGDAARRCLQPGEFACPAPCRLGEAVEIAKRELPSPLPRERLDPRHRRRPERQRAAPSVTVKAPQRGGDVGRAELEPVAPRHPGQPGRRDAGGGEQARTLRWAGQGGEPGARRFVVSRRGAELGQRRRQTLHRLKRPQGREFGQTPPVAGVGQRLGDQVVVGDPFSGPPPCSTALLRAAGR